MGSGTVGAMTESQRPDLDATLSGSELRRWYWLRTELADLARSLGISPAGGKIELTERLAAALDGQAVPGPTRRTSRVTQLEGPLTDATVLPPGQRCSQALREFFGARVGAGFAFDDAMRSFIATGAGRTLGDAVDHWYATRSAPRPEIGPQFELNRFTRTWHQDHPDGTRSELLVAWRAHRVLPVDGRAS